MFSTSHCVKVNFVGIYLIIITDKSTSEVLYLGQNLFLITPLLNFQVLHCNHCKHSLWICVFEQVSTSTTWICLYNIHLVFQSIINITIKIRWIFIIDALHSDVIITLININFILRYLPGLDNSDHLILDPYTNCF